MTESFIYCNIASLSPRKFEWLQSLYTLWLSNLQHFCSDICLYMTFMSNILLQWTWEIDPFQHLPIGDCYWTSHERYFMFHSEQRHPPNRETCRKHRLERFLLQLHRHVNCVLVLSDSLVVIFSFSVYLTFSLPPILTLIHRHSLICRCTCYQTPHLLLYLLTQTFTQSITCSLLSWISSLITHVPTKPTN